MAYRRQTNENREVGFCALEVFLDDEAKTEGVACDL